MGAEKILRNTGLLAATGLVALALAAVPVAPGLDAGLAGLNSAQAKGNGNGGGSNNGGGHGNSGNAGGHGNAGGQGGGVSTENDEPANFHGMTASAMKGLNAVHASANAFADGHASEYSMVGQIRTAVISYATGIDTEEPDGFDGLVDTDIIEEFDETGDPSFQAALEGILGEDITDDAYNEVKSLADDKVEVPDPE